MKKTLFLIIPALFLLNGCGYSEYNLGIATTSEEYLKDVKVRLFPSGRMDSISLNCKNGIWLRYENYWSVPEKIKIYFRDPDGKNNELQMNFSLPANFKGDIVVVIYKEKEEYRLKKIVGKPGELDMDLLLEKF